MSVKIFDIDYLDIPLVGMDEGDIIVCLDPQKRLGEKTYAVLIYFTSPSAKGLFWDKNLAVSFANSLEEGA